MTFEPKIYKLKSGHSIGLRVATEEDAQRLIDLKRSYIKDTTTIPLLLNEYQGKLDSEVLLIDEYINSLNSILLVADCNGELIGNIDLTGSGRSKMFHTAMIGMGIKEEWRNQGLGKILIESTLQWAKDHSEIEIVWLDVYASNKLGYNLYKNTGFQVSGTISGFFKEEDGYKDKVQMYQRIRERQTLIE